MIDKISRVLMRVKVKVVYYKFINVVRRGIKSLIDVVFDGVFDFVLERV